MESPVSGPNVRVHNQRNSIRSDLGKEPRSHRVLRYNPKAFRDLRPPIDDKRWIHDPVEDK